MKQLASNLKLAERGASYRYFGLPDRGCGQVTGHLLHSIQFGGRWFCSTGYRGDVALLVGSPDGASAC